MNTILPRLSIVLALVAGVAQASDEISEFVLPSGVKVRLVEAPFTEERFRVSLCHEGAPICRIDGKVPFGTVGERPTTYLKEISITYGKVRYRLDTSNMFNAWGKRPLEYPGVVRYFGGFCYDGKTCVVRGLFADGGASFVAEWSVVGGYPQRTVLTDSSDVVQLFMKNIDPPRFD